MLSSHTVMSAGYGKCLAEYRCGLAWAPCHRPGCHRPYVSVPRAQRFSWPCTLIPPPRKLRIKLHGDTPRGARACMDRCR